MIRAGTENENRRIWSEDVGVEGEFSVVAGAGDLVEEGLSGWEVEGTAGASVVFGEGQVSGDVAVVFDELD